jgi:predicted nucleic acid-binding protein
MNFWLDTTALVELNFRQERHAEAVRQALPEGAEVGVSAYVLFELARGYLTKLRELLDLTFVCEFPDELREKVESKRMGGAPADGFVDGCVE